MLAHLKIAKLTWYDLFSRLNLHINKISWLIEIPGWPGGTGETHSLPEGTERQAPGNESKPIVTEYHKMYEFFPESIFKYWNHQMYLNLLTPASRAWEAAGPGGSIDGEVKTQVGKGGKVAFFVLPILKLASNTFFL